MKLFALSLLPFALIACRGTPPVPAPFANLAANPAALELEQRWIDETPLARFPSATDVDANLRAARRAAFAWNDPFRDPAGLLTPDLRQQLLDRLAEHAAVRSLRSPDAYLSLADREPPSVWQEIEDSCFHDSYEQVMNEPPPTGSSRAVFEDVWNVAMNDLGGRFTALGTGASSASLRVHRTNDGQHWAPWMHEYATAEETAFWAGPFARSCFAVLRLPERSIHDVIAVHGSAIAAECLVRVRTASGVHAIWMSEWHYDPDASTWIASRMLPYSVRPVPIFN